MSLYSLFIVVITAVESSKTSKLTLISISLSIYYLGRDSKSLKILEGFSNMEGK